MGRAVAAVLQPSSFKGAFLLPGCLGFLMGPSSGAAVRITPPAVEYSYLEVASAFAVQRDLGCENLALL